MTVENHDLAAGKCYKTKGAGGADQIWKVEDLNDDTIRSRLWDNGTWTAPVSTQREAFLRDAIAEVQSPG